MTLAGIGRFLSTPKNVSLGIVSTCMVFRPIITMSNKEIPIERCFKNVWIITRSDSPQLIKTVGNIKVKEIPINSLIKIHHKRMSDEFDLEKELQNL